MLQQFIHWVCVDDSSLGRPSLPGAPPTQELGRPMMLLNVLHEFCGDDLKLRQKYYKQIEWSVQAIQSHVRVVYNTLLMLQLHFLVLYYSTMGSGCMSTC